MRNVVVISLMFVTAVAACNRPRSSSDSLDNQAMSALESSENVAQSNFGGDFWADQEKRNTPLWQRAMVWCNQAEHKVLQNCQELQAAATLQQFYAAPMPPVTNASPGTLGVIPPAKH
jgi:Tfp pilus assembly protein PilV